jgi:hypothetical protein
MSTPPAPPVDANAVGLHYDFGPSGANFSSPITITLKYNPNISDPSKLYIAWWNASAGQWVQLATTVNNTNHTLTATITHFTVFTILAPAVQNVELKINMWDKSGLAENWFVDNQGYLQKVVDVTSLDGTMTINIPLSAKIVDASGNPLAEMSVAPIASPAVAPKGYHILKSFHFLPDGAQFDPGMTITISFNASDVADGKTVVLAFYNETDGKWEFIEGTNNGDVTATFTITHFSVYSLMSKTSTHSIWFWIAISGSGAIILLLAALLYRRVYKLILTAA